jgi:hypothetical protein
VLPINESPVLPPLRRPAPASVPADGHARCRRRRGRPRQCRPGLARAVPAGLRRPSPPFEGAAHGRPRHPLPYAFAKATRCCWKTTASSACCGPPRPPGFGAVRGARLFDVAASSANRRHAGAAHRAAYAGGESSAAAVIGEVESGVDLSRMMQDLPAVEDLLEAANDAPIIRMLNALLTQAAKDGASDIHIEPYERSSACASASTARCARWCSPTRRCTRR